MGKNETNTKQKKDNTKTKNEQKAKKDNKDKTKTKNEQTAKKDNKDKKDEREAPASTSTASSAWWTSTASSAWRPKRYWWPKPRRNQHQYDADDAYWAHRTREDS